MKLGKQDTVDSVCTDERACAPEQNAGYLSQLEGSVLFQNIIYFGATGLPLLTVEDLERRWLMVPEGGWC